MPNRPKAIPAAVLTVALVALAAALPADRAPAQQPTTSLPNILVILTDDQTVAELNSETMPATMRRLAGEGTEFTNSFVSSPLCCPSRAGSLTGQYPHNSGVFDNEPGYAALLGKDSTVYSWLDARGYRTGHIGRWLLNYEREPAPDAGYETDGGFRPPAGIDDWFGYVGGPVKYYGATFSDNGVPVQLGDSRRDYTTRVINREAREFVTESSAGDAPFFLTVAPMAPHSSNDTAPGECGTGGLPIAEPGAVAPFKDEPLPKPPSFGEERIGDKPAWVRSRPTLNPRRLGALKAGYRCALASLSTVDRGIRALVQQLERSGELDRTAIFLTSDNGYFFGEHRLVLNKVFPYEEAIRVPLLARVPPALIDARQGGPPRMIDRLVNNLDLTATILDLAGDAPPCHAGVCRAIDGRSLVPLLRGRTPDWARSRGLLIQIGSVRNCGSLPNHPGGLNRFYDAIRTTHHLYVELNRLNRETGACDTPEFELYDLRKDPHQLRNIAADPAVETPSALQLSLAARLEALRNCSGPGCG